MATKIRLQRHGHKDYAFYPIVIADSRAPRDGKFIERIGYYNPNTNPATISLNFDRALYWLNVGAIPTDTVRNILSREGVMLMKHLQGGVKKGAFSAEEAQKRFDAWKAEKTSKLQAIKVKELDAKRAEGKGEGYIQWAKMYNLKMKAKTLIYLQEHKLTHLEDLYDAVDAAHEKTKEGLANLKAIEAELAMKKDLQKQVAAYRASKKLYDEYKTLPKKNAI